MAVHHHPHLLDFSPPPPPPPPPMEEAPPPSFSHGHLFALHTDGAGMPGGGVLSGAAADDSTAASWPQAAATAVSLSLYDYNDTAGASSSSLMVGGHHQHPFAAVSVAPPHHQHLPPAAAAATMQPFQLGSSRYLGPVKELLGEFCSLDGGVYAMDGGDKRAPKAGKWDDVEALTSSSSSPGLWGSPALSSMDFLELERRKARLLSMVEEVDRRYRRYREQLRTVAAAFEAVAGAGAAQVYTRLALRAMSRHFRCLRDALVAQVRALRTAMGDAGGAGGGAAAAVGATKGDTPRLRALDQCLRQQRAFQQSPGGAAADGYPWRPQRGLPERAVAVLRAWLFEHFLHPYPNDVDKHILARQTGLSRSQVSNWFINARVRLWKPMIEDMYTEEVKQSEGNQNPSSTGVKSEKNTMSSATNLGGESHFSTFRNPNSAISSSIMTDEDHFHGYPNLQGSSSTVSLTLGLQQQSFAPSMMQQQSLILEGQEEDGVLPYRNLMGSQLMHHFAG
ncbi:hypothetical protein ACP4OV_017095 [Aristida adscensionis]